MRRLHCYCSIKPSIISIAYTLLLETTGHWVIYNGGRMPSMRWSKKYTARAAVTNEFECHPLTLTTVSIAISQPRITFQLPPIIVS